MKKLYPKAEYRTARTQQEVKTFLERLVWNRFSLPQLNKKVSDFFQEKLELYNSSEEREKSGDSDELADWNLMFNVVREEQYELFGDVYVLPTRELDEEDNVRYYVTEVGYEFDGAGSYACVNCGGGFYKVTFCEERDADFCEDCYKKGK